MFALIESGRAPRQRGEWTSRTLSLAMHAGLITVAVMATKQVVHDVEPPIVPLTIPSWSSPPRRPAPAPCGACQLPGRPFPSPFPVPIPDPTMEPPSITPTPAPGAPGEPGAPALNPPAPGSGLVPGLPLDSRVVDEPPELLSHPEPQYPEVLRQAGIEGSVVIEAVLDTTGHAEPGSMRVVTAAHPLFEAEAQRVVIGSRYRPARMAGHAVRVRVRIPIRFGIRR